MRTETEIRDWLDRFGQRLATERLTHGRAAAVVGAMDALEWVLGDVDPLDSDEPPAVRRDPYPRLGTVVRWDNIDWTVVAITDTGDVRIEREAAIGTASMVIPLESVRPT